MDGTVAAARAVAAGAALVLAGIALIWAAAIVSHTSGYVELPRLFESWEMQNTAVEEYRETYGLLIVAAWMIVAGAWR